MADKNAQSNAPKGPVLDSGYKWDVALVALRLPGGLYVFQRRDAGAPTSPNLLSFFGGRAETGESGLAAALRELREETSLTFSDEQMIPIVSFPRSANNKTAHLYLLNITSDTFDVFEGAGAETHKLEDIILRGDVADGTRIGSIYLLRRMKD